MSRQRLINITSIPIKIRLSKMRIFWGIVAVTAICFPFIRRAEQIWRMLKQVWQPSSWLYLTSSLSLLVVSFFILALTWHGILQMLGGNLPCNVAIKLYGLTLLPRYIPGTLWGYAGRVLLCERETVPIKPAVHSIMAEVGLIVLTGAVTAALRYVAGMWIFVLAFVATVTIILEPVVGRIVRQRCVPPISKLALWCKWMMSYIWFWLLYGISNWLIVLSIAPTAGLPAMQDIISGAATAWLLGFLVVVVPSGLGVREWMLALTLLPIVGLNGGIFVSLMARMNVMAAEVLFCLFCLFTYHSKHTH